MNPIAGPGVHVANSLNPHVEFGLASSQGWIKALSCAADVVEGRCFHC